MATKIRFHPTADREAEKAFRWYLRRSSRAADGFEQALTAAIVAVQDKPERWPKYLHQTRCYKLKKYPFLVVYRPHRKAWKLWPSLIQVGDRDIGAEDDLMIELGNAG